MNVLYIVIAALMFWAFLFVLFWGLDREIHIDGNWKVGLKWSTGAMLSVGWVVVIALLLTAGTGQS